MRAVEHFWQLLQVRTYIVVNDGDYLITNESRTSFLQVFENTYYVHGLYLNLDIASKCCICQEFVFKLGLPVDWGLAGLSIYFKQCP